MYSMDKQELINLLVSPIDLLSSSSLKKLYLALNKYTKFVEDMLSENGIAIPVIGKQGPPTQESSSVTVPDLKVSSFINTLLVRASLSIGGLADRLSDDTGSTVAFAAERIEALVEGFPCIKDDPVSPKNINTCLIELQEIADAAGYDLKLQLIKK